MVTNEVFLLKTILRHQKYLTWTFHLIDMGKKAGKQSWPQDKDLLGAEHAAVLLAGSPIFSLLLKLYVFAGYATGIWDF